MSGIWPVFTIHIQDIKSLGPEYGQWKLPIFRISILDVWNMASRNFPYSGHQKLMSGMWTVKTCHIPDITNIFCPYSGHHSPYSGRHCPSSGHHCPYSGQHCLYFGHHCPYSGQHCLYFGHHFFLFILDIKS